MINGNCTIVYGLNSNTDTFLNSEYNEGNNIFACTSGKESYKNTEIYSLTDIANLDISSIKRIVICSMFVSEISESLMTIGFEIEKLFFFNHAYSKLTPCNELLIPSIQEDDILYAFYDLSNNLPCYDIINFCVLADIERQKKGLKYIHFIIVPDLSINTKKSGFRVFHSEQDYKWRVDKILKGVIACVPNSVGVTELPYKELAVDFIKERKHIAPLNYVPISNPSTFKDTSDFSTLGNKFQLSIFSPPPTARSLINKFIEDRIDGRKLVTINLREYEIHTDRNSNVAEWELFLNQLDKTIFYPVIIRDTYCCTQKFNNDLDHYDSIPIASLDFSIRVALYEAAFINLSVSNGPSYIYNFIKGVRSITFMKVNENNPAISTATFNKAGVYVNEHLSYRDNEFQHLCWEKENFDNINMVFKKLTLKIKRELT